jgi:hypothetical protein
VVALRLAVPVPPSQVVGNEDPEPSGPLVATTADGDDTERWFAALARSDDAKRSEGARPRRRKHRASSPCAHELAFDPAPAPIPRVNQPNAALTSSTCTGRDFGSLLPSAVGALSANLAGTSWRRGTLLLATLLLFALLGTRFLAANDRRQRPSHDRVLARTVRVQLATRISPRPIVHHAALPVQQAVATRRPPRGVRARRRAARQVDRISNPEPAPVEVTSAPSQDRPAATAATAMHAPASSSGQFAYLGQ